MLKIIVICNECFGHEVAPENSVLSVSYGSFGLVLIWWTPELTWNTGQEVGN